mmetsp:Transcript_10788/g.28325  ORF Transcript_10788/g.28325 Transcript_10788/m.28325 type:complete len:90 (-) Transcript_10788:377-646(-)
MRRVRALRLQLIRSVPSGRVCIIQRIEKLQRELLQAEPRVSSDFDATTCVGGFKQSMRAGQFGLVLVDEAHTSTRISTARYRLPPYATA